MRGLSPDTIALLAGVFGPILAWFMERTTRNWRRSRATTNAVAAVTDNGATGDRLTDNLLQRLDQMNNRVKTLESRVTDLEEQRDRLEREIQELGTQRQRLLIFGRRALLWYATLPEDVKKGLPSFPEPHGIEDIE